MNRRFSSWPSLLLFSFGLIGTGLPSVVNAQQNCAKLIDAKTDTSKVDKSKTDSTKKDTLQFPMVTPFQTDSTFFSPTDPRCNPGVDEFGEPYQSGHVDHDGVTTLLLHPSQVEFQFNPGLSGKIKLGYPNALSGEFRRLNYDRKYGPGFKNTLDLAVRTGSILRIRSAGIATTDRYDLTIAAMVASADRIEIQKVSGNAVEQATLSPMNWFDIRVSDTKINVFYHENGVRTLLGPVCYGCPVRTLNHVYSVLSQNLKNFSGRKVVFHTAYSPENAILPVDFFHQTAVPHVRVRRIQDVNTKKACGWSVAIQQGQREDPVYSSCLTNAFGPFLANQVRRTETIWRIQKEFAKTMNWPLLISPNAAQPEGEVFAPEMTGSLFLFDWNQR